VWKTVAWLFHIVLICVVHVKWYPRTLRIRVGQQEKRKRKSD
jgi:hypothetical protein